MKLTVLENPSSELIAFLDKQIIEFNWAHWEVSERLPLAVEICDGDETIAGAHGRTFGNWLQITSLWVSEAHRHLGLGKQVLEAIENAGKARGCISVVLDTLNFQAKPFYEKYGYQVQWVQENYPKTGAKYYMTKQL